MKIIVADDHYVNRLLVLEILKSLGHEYIEAENGLQALEALEMHNDIDMVLMDIEMPIMGGFEAMKHIRQKLTYPKREVPIIALTAHNPGMFVQECSDSGFNEMLGKPFSIEKIAELLADYNKS